MKEYKATTTKRFFKPFVGSEYQHGINGKRVLVLGASFYCGNNECQFFEKCTSTRQKDSSDFDASCPVYQKESKLLQNEPSYCISEAHSTYKTFTRYFEKFLNADDYDEVWKHLAFTNYVQFFLPAEQKKYRDTRSTDLSERDFEAFNETLTELQPHVVIIWGCVINKRLREENEFLIDKQEITETDGYICRIKMPNIVHEITLINPYHPSSRSWNSALESFDQHLSRILQP